MAEAQIERGLLLTWQRDPTTTMTIDRHTEGDSRDWGITDRVRNN